MRWILIVLLFLSSAVMANDEKCFNPEEDVTVKKFLKPNKSQILSLDTKTKDQPDEENFGEDEKTIKAIHEKIREAYAQINIDPRIIYGIMIAQSQGNPFSERKEGNIKYYGLFGFKGADIDQVKQKCGKAKQPRICQVEFYVDTFIKGRKAIVSQACKGQEWEKLSEGEKLSYLDTDGCSTGILKSDWLGNSERTYYVNSGAKDFVGQLINWADLDTLSSKAVPLCEDYYSEKPKDVIKVPAPGLFNGFGGMGSDKDTKIKIEK